jgi:hypothetical protein
MRWLVPLALAGCSFHPDNGVTDARPVIDGAADGRRVDGAPTDAPALPACVGSDLGLGVNFCPTHLSGSAIEISSDVAFKTDSGMSSDAQLVCGDLMGGDMGFCPIIANTIKIDQGARLFGWGPQALVLIATEGIDIEGILDVASHDGGSAGAGAPAACMSSINPSAGGGGAGGSYASVGASGGIGNNGAGGTPGGAIEIDALTTGCKGGTGGGGAQGGAGGGVVFIATPTLIIGDSGQIDASGGPGQGTDQQQAGGGGGGTGGLIALVVLQAPSLGSGAQIYANGGPGAGGSSNAQGSTDGSDPTGASSGGGGGTCIAGCNGGTGGVGATRAATASGGGSGTSNDGGGGGGGGLGAIVVRPMSSLSVVVDDANVSPQPM